MIDAFLTGFGFVLGGICGLLALICVLGLLAGVCQLMGWD